MFEAERWQPELVTLYGRAWKEGLHVVHHQLGGMITAAEPDASLRAACPDADSFLTAAIDHVSRTGGLAWSVSHEAQGSTISVWVNRQRSKGSPLEPPTCAALIRAAGDVEQVNLDDALIHTSTSISLFLGDHLLLPVSREAEPHRSRFLQYTACSALMG